MDEMTQSPPEPSEVKPMTIAAQARGTEVLSGQDASDGVNYFIKQVQHMKTWEEVINDTETLPAQIIFCFL